VDVPEEEIEAAVKNASLKESVDFHEYYNSVLYENKDEVASLWTELKATPENIKQFVVLEKK